jgi:hypothetical protein
MRLDVTGRRPWPGPKWDACQIVLEGVEQPSPYALEDGEAAEYSLGVGQPRIYAFGIRRLVAHPRGRPRQELRELRIDRIEVAQGDSPARLVANFGADSLELVIGDERSKTRLEALLGSLPLLQLPPPIGRPVGHAPLDAQAVQLEVLAAIRAQRDADHSVGRVTQAQVAERRNQSERQLRRDLAECELDWRALLRSA